MKREQTDLTRLLLTFKALSDETRMGILAILRQGEVCVCDIAENLKTTQPNISFHLGMLKEAGLICDRKEGRWVFYSLDDTDVFNRFLLLGIFERVDCDPVKKKKRSRGCREG